jgi:hypothetical protein
MSNDIPAPLQGDPARQAPDLHRGIAFQQWRSVEAWVNLKAGEALYLEGAEDFDVVSETDAATIQTRATAANISLRSDGITESLRYFWRLRRTHPDKVITFRYVTTSGVAQEDKPALGPGIKGLEYWERCAVTGDEAMAEQLRLFLAEDKIIRPKLEEPLTEPGGPKPQTLLEFLDTAKAKDVLEQLISRVKWDVGSEDSEVVRQSVVMRVNAHGRNFGLRPLDCASAVDRLYRVAATVAGQDQDRLLTRADFIREFDDATQRTLTAGDRATNDAGADVMREALGGGAQSVEFLLEAAGLIHAGIPPVGNPIVPRASLIAKLAAQAEKEQVMVLHGLSGLGKTKTARLLAGALGGDWIWADFQGIKVSSLPAVVRLLAAHLGGEQAQNVALDNLNYGNSELQSVDSELAAIVRLTRLNQGKIIIGTQRELGTRTMQKARLDQENIVKIPRLSEEEVQEFCTLLGCPAELAPNQAKVVWLLTSGHPQLVHARLAVLAQLGWSIGVARRWVSERVRSTNLPPGFAAGSIRRTTFSIIRPRRSISSGCIYRISRLGCVPTGPSTGKSSRESAPLVTPYFARLCPA